MSRFGSSSSVAESEQNKKSSSVILRADEWAESFIACAVSLHFFLAAQVLQGRPLLSSSSPLWLSSVVVYSKRKGVYGGKGG